MKTQDIHSNSRPIDRAVRAGWMAAAIPLVVLSICLPQSLRAASLTDFGYQNKQVNGALATGSLPLLVILVNFAGEPPLTNPPSFFADLIFNPARVPSFNGYFQAVSNRRFSYAKAGVIGPLSLSAAETEASYPYNPGFKDGAYCSNIVYKAMMSGLFNFGNFDANHDGHVTPNELQILIINQDTLWGLRPAGRVKPAGFAYDWSGGVSVVTPQAPFVVMVEETEEGLGMIDIYSGECLSYGLTPQSCFDGNAPWSNTYYLDPWHRMQLGWSEPRIRSLSAGGMESIPAAQMGVTNAPLILYDPVRGANEFFILEYRTQTSPAGAGYDANVADNGLAIWHVQQDGNHNPTSVPNLAGTTPDIVVWNEGPPNLQRGGSSLWGSDAVTPSLSWVDGTPMPNRIFVRPFTLGDSTITVEWRRESGVAQTGPNFVVTTVDDHDDGLPGILDCTLREAIDAARHYPGASTITFAPAVTGAITLTGGELVIGDALDIIGPGAGTLSVNGNNSSRVFHITRGKVTISGLTLRNAGSLDGCIRNEASADLTVDRCTLSGNLSSGIFNSGTLLVSKSTISGNTASPTVGSGGGIYNNSGFVSVRDSTLAGNSAPVGGGIANFGVLAIANSTLSGNAATCCGSLSGIGGGIHSGGGTVTIRSTIVAGNSALINGADVSGPFTSAGYNLIGKTDGSSGFSNGANHDRTGTAAAPINPLLGPLQNNGAPMFTMAPLPGSPAIDQGGNTTSADQRGRSRPIDDPAIPNATGGNGSDIGAVEVGHFVVTNLDDNGLGSLRGAILSAAAADSITFAPGLSGTITLTNGELAINQHLTIMGPGANLLAVSGNMTSRVFNIGSVAVNLSGLSIRDGFVGSPGCAEGGGIYNAGVLSLTACAVMDNVVRGIDGADGLDDEVAGSDGDPGGCGRGAGIYNANILLAKDSTISGNSAIGGIGGNGGNASGSLVISVGGKGGAGGSARGGAVDNGPFTTNALVNCTMSGNLARGGGGGSGGSADPDATHSTGGPGGKGGAANGGGVSALSTSALSSCTIAGNSATGAPGGLGGAGKTRGARGANASGAGGGIYAGALPPAVHNTLVAGNTAVSGPDCGGSFLSQGFNMIGQADGSVGFGSPGDQLGSSATPLQPRLGPLQDNGGPTLTRALLPGSPAIDGGKSPYPNTDQRGRLRPYDYAVIANATGGDGSDIGAFELSAPPLILTGPVRNGTNLVVRFSSELGQRYRVERKDALAPGAWTTVADNISGTGGIMSVTDLGAANQSKRFYRGQVLP